MDDKKETHIPDLSFRAALGRLDAANLLLKVADEVDTDLEMTSVLFKQTERAMLFKNVRGYDTRVVGNFLGCEENVLEIYEHDISGLRDFIGDGLANPIAPKVVDEGPVQAVYRNNPDLLEYLPLPRYAPNDGGRYISGGVVIAKDPDTGVNNASYHRFMHVEDNKLLIQLDLGRDLRALWERAKEKGEELPIAIVIGADVGLQYAAGMMGAQLPRDMDEFDVASGLSRKPLELIDCKTIPLQVPADAEFIMEGTISPDVEMEEGPFLEFVGLYSDVSPSPLTTINCIYHREDPIWHVIMTKEAPILRKHVLEGAILKAVKASAPCVTDVALTPGGLYRFHLLISVNKKSAADEGYQRNAIFAAIAALKDLDLVIVVDDDINIHDWNDVEWALATRWDASKGLITMPGARGHEYVSISDKGVRTKVGIDASLPYGFAGRYKRVPVAPADIGKYDTTLEPGGL